MSNQVIVGGNTKIPVRIRSKICFQESFFPLRYQGVRTDRNQILPVTQAITLSVFVAEVTFSIMDNNTFSIEYKFKKKNPIGIPHKLTRINVVFSIYR